MLTMMIQLVLLLNATAVPQVLIVCTGHQNKIQFISIRMCKTIVTSTNIAQGKTFDTAFGRRHKDHTFEWGGGSCDSPVPLELPLVIGRKTVHYVLRYDR